MSTSDPPPKNTARESCAAQRGSAPTARRNKPKQLAQRLGYEIVKSQPATTTP